jgi:undecaprenyl diphosphate synthase
MSFLNHIAIIPDGNRRWAKKRRMPSFFGHREGAKTAEEIFKTAFNLKIPYVTFWGCSVNNVVKRPKLETVFLLKLFEQHFKNIIKNKEIHKNKVKINALGRWEEFFSKGAKLAIKKAIDITKEYKNLHLNFLLAYSGVDEMTEAIEKISKSNLSHPPTGGGGLNSKLTINEKLIKNNLWTKDLPPVDLIIRTGETSNWLHWSDGFMMWDVANTQIYSTETLWPDFSDKEFKKIIERFESVERRMGK